MTTYAQAGVDIDKGNAFVNSLKSIVKSTHRKEVLSGLGGFGGLFELPAGYQTPVLISATDGVGTKLRLASTPQQHYHIGIDLVAMCVNDLVVCGGEPLFFLDYYATGKLDPTIALEVVKGIAEGCLQAGCALIGGETAEMPGHYANGDYDIAGFSVGIVEKSKIIDGANVQPGDVLIGLNSSGPHANGFSLIRKILADQNIHLNQTLDNKSLDQHLLPPTKIYVKSLLALYKEIPIHALAHITGGGITENLPRVLPEYTQANIALTSFTRPSIFNWLQQQADLDESEMLRTFNCGIGMIVCVAKANAERALELLLSLGEQAQVIGHIEKSTQQQAFVNYHDV